MVESTPATAPTTEPTPTATDNATVTERVVILGIFGALAVISLLQNNLQAATAFASTIGVYFLSRQGA